MNWVGLFLLGFLYGVTSQEMEPLGKVYLQDDQAKILMGQQLDVSLVRSGPQSLTLNSHLNLDESLLVQSLNTSTQISKIECNVTSHSLSTERWNVNQSLQVQGPVTVQTQIHTESVTVTGPIQAKTLKHSTFWIASTLVKTNPRLFVNVPLPVSFDSLIYASPHIVSNPPLYNQWTLMIPGLYLVKASVRVSHTPVPDDNLVVAIYENSLSIWVSAISRTTLAYASGMLCLPWVSKRLGYVILCCLIEMNVSLWIALYSKNHGKHRSNDGFNSRPEQWYCSFDCHLSTV